MNLTDDMFQGIRADWTARTAMLFKASIPHY